jgi:hypothetical protein
MNEMKNEIIKKNFQKLVTNKKLVQLVIKERELEKELSTIRREISHINLNNEM